MMLGEPNQSFRSGRALNYDYGRHFPWNQVIIFKVDFNKKVLKKFVSDMGNMEPATWKNEDKEVAKTFDHH